MGNRRNTFVNFCKKKLFYYLSSFFLIFILISLLTSIQPNYRLSSDIIKNMTKDIDSTSFLYLMGMEANVMKEALPEDKTFSNLAHLLFQVVTNVKPDEFQSLFGQELPGLIPKTNIFIVKSTGIDYTNYPFESSPPLKDVLEDREAVYEEEIEEIEEKETEINTGDRKVVFLYSTHNRESFLPHLPDVTNPNLAFHKEVNISKVSEHFAKALENNGIGTEVDFTDHMQVLNDNNWTYGMSYRASRKVVEEAMANNKDVQYIFDIHRDALPRERTTITIDGETYGQILFVIGLEHEQYEKNLALASTLHRLIDEKYPGLSKGILTKEGPGNNGIYNQDVMDTALLFEIGGYENTLEELYRTVEVLADIFSDYYWEAEKVFLNE